MEHYSWVFLLFAAIPEVFLTVSFSTVLVGCRFRPRPALGIAVFYSPLLLLLRTIFPLGMHTVISLVIMPLIISRLYKISYKKAFVPFSITISLLIMLEMSAYFIWVYITGIRFQYSELTAWQRVIANTPTNILLALLLIFILFLKRRQSITPFMKTSQHGKG